MSFEGAILPSNFKKQNFSIGKRGLPIEYNDELKKYVVPMDYFRDLFVQSNSPFTRVINELSLRGVEFVTDSPYFPKKSSDFDDEEYISSFDVKNEMAYQRIDFNVLGIGATMKSMRIKSNNFFDNIPLKGFLNLQLSKSDLSLLRSMLEDNGFKIGSMNFPESDRPVNNANKTSMVISEDLASKKTINKLNRILKEFYNNDILNASKLEFAIKNDSILEIFRNEGIRFFYELNTIHGIQVLNVLKSNVLEYLIDTLPDIKKEKRYLAESSSNFLSENNEINSVVIEDLFENNGLNKVIIDLKKDNIFTLSDLAVPLNMNKLFNENGVGGVKIAKIMGLFVNVVKDPNILKNIDDLSEKNTDYYFALGQVNNIEYRQKVIDKEIVFANLDQIKDIIFDLKLKKPEKRRICDNLPKVYNFHDIKMVPEEYNLKLLKIIDILNITFVKGKIEESSSLFQSLNQNINTIIDQLKMDSLKSRIIKDIAIYYSEMIDNLTSMREILNEVFKNPIEQLIISDRILNNKYTLEEVGNKANVTRERIRQIEAKILTRTKQILLKYGLEFYKNRVEDKSIIKVSSDDVISVLIAKYGNFDGLYYAEYINSIVPISSENTLKKLETILISIKKSRNIVSNVEFDNSISELQNDSNEDLINVIKNNSEKIVVSYGLKIYKNYIFPVKMPKIQAIDFIVNNYYKTGINTIDNDDLFKLKACLEEILGDDVANEFFSGDKKKLTKRLNSILDKEKDLVKIRSNEYAPFNKDLIPKDILNSMFDFISKELDKNDVLLTSKIFKEFAPKLNGLKVTEYYMYYTLKYFFSNVFTFGHGNTMRIYKKNESEKDTYSVIKNILSKNNDCISLEKLRERFGFELYTIEQICIIHSDLLLANGYLRTVDVSFSKEFVSYIKSKGEYLLNKKGYILVKRLQEELIFDKRYSKELIKSGSKDINVFAKLIRPIFSEYKGHSNMRYITLKSDSFSILDVLLMEIKESIDSYKFTREDFSKVGKDSLGYGVMTVYKFLQQGIDSGQILPLDEDYLIGKDDFDIDNDQLNEVKDYLNNKLLEKDYLTITQLRGLNVDLPPIDFDWTPELLDYVAVHLLSYKKVDAPVQSYRSDPLIICKKDSSLTYVELIKRKLSEYTGNSYKTDVSKYLVKNGLMKYKENGDYHIPNQLLKDHVLVLDSVNGSISLGDTNV